MKRALCALVLGSLFGGSAAAQAQKTEGRPAPRQKVNGLKATVFRASSRGNYLVVYDQTFNRNVVSLDQARVTRLGKSTPVKSADELRGGDLVLVHGEVSPL